MRVPVRAMHKYGNTLTMFQEEHQQPLLRAIERLKKQGEPEDAVPSRLKLVCFRIQQVQG